MLLVGINEALTVHKYEGYLCGLVSLFLPYTADDIPVNIPEIKKEKNK
jgi:hypothetical protein